MVHPDNIAEVAELRPDYMGFIFWQGSKRNAEGLDAEVVKSLPEDILRVGVFVNATLDELMHTVEKYGLQMVQLHGDESPAMCTKIRDKGILVAKAVGMADPSDVAVTKYYENCTDLLILDTKSKQRGGTGIAYDRNLLLGYRGKVPFLMSGGVSPQDVEKVKSMQLPGMIGVDVNSRFELSPGVKDVETLKKFITELRKD